MALQLNSDNHNDGRPRVLVVDDELNIRQAISIILQSEFHVTALESGEKAHEKFQQGMDFDVVSLDLQMPGMSGIETLRAIKACQPLTEILIVTAHSDFESAREALKYGAYEYIDKPFNKDVYRAAIRKGVQRRHKSVESEKAIEKLAFVKAQLVQSEKFAALGQLIAGVVHELNNPMGAIIGLSELLLLKEWSPEETRDYIEKIHEGSQLCSSIIQKFLSFSRKKAPKRELGQINPVIDSVLKLKQEDFKMARIQVIRQLADNTPDTMADFDELKQVFLNIINNAHQAIQMHNGTGRLTIKSEFDDKSIRISFQDSGPGIPKENLQNIFEPLFTTKEEGKGTGLGLSICYDIIKAHKGNIYVASEENAGACFVIELPFVGKPSQSETFSAPHPPADQAQVSPIARQGGDGR